MKEDRKISPEGWHVPTDEDWKQLEIYLGMNPLEADYEGFMRGTNEGGKLKSIGIVLWNSPNSGATNESGFSALPSGFRGRLGDFVGMGNNAAFWSSTENYRNCIWSREIYSYFTEIARCQYVWEDGASIRCVKD